jgi:hypothetical protein
MRLPLLSLVLLASLVACASPQNTGKRSAEVHVKEEKGALKIKDQEMSAEGLLIRRSDLNRDGKPDLVKYLKVVGTNEFLVRKEFDLNFDGRPDVFKYYDEKGKVVKERKDHDFDGKIDSVTLFEDEQLARQEVDLNFDEKPDLIKYYEKGRISRKEADVNQDGKVDYWEYYEDGKVDRIGVDRDGDGEVDDWQKATENG